MKGSIVDTCSVSGKYKVILYFKIDAVMKLHTRFGKLNYKIDLKTCNTHQTWKI